MKKLFPKILSGGLLACFLFVSIGLSGQAAAHTLHHAKHKSTTHASLLCSWVCSAGQVLQAHDFGFHGPILTLVLIEQDIPQTMGGRIPWSPSSRAPPLSILSI